MAGTAAGTGDDLAMTEDAMISLLSEATHLACGRMTAQQCLSFMERLARGAGTARMTVRGSRKSPRVAALVPALPQVRARPLSEHMIAPAARRARAKPGEHLARI
jgi:hypothetical protein